MKQAIYISNHPIWRKSPTYYKVNSVDLKTNPSTAMLFHLNAHLLPPYQWFLAKVYARIFAVWHDMSYSGNMLINYGNGSAHKSIFIGKPQPLDNDFFLTGITDQLYNVKHCADHPLYCNIQWCSTTNSGHLRLTVGKDLWDLGVATLHNTYNTNPKQDSFLAFQM